MAQLLGIRIQNYRSLADVAIGQTEYGKGRSEPLPRFSTFIGPNGAGKSTLLDAFGFIAQCLAEGVEAACDHPGRGGYARLLTQGSSGPIRFELFFFVDDPRRPMVYELAIGEKNGVPAVAAETLRQRRATEVRGKPYYFLKLANGIGKVWAGTDGGRSGDALSSEKVTLSDRGQLGISSFGNNLDKHPAIVRVRQYIERWYLSYFVPDAARGLPATGPQRWLDRTGSNVGNVLQYFERQHKARYKGILKQIAQAIPGIEKVSTEASKDRRLLIRFNEAGYTDPFFQASMSDGTLKMLAYAVLLADPEPRPFIGIEEPENGLYVELVETLARQLNDFASARDSGTQVLVTTHSPYFVDALRPEQVWFVAKGDDGKTRVTRASAMPGIQAFVRNGLPLGSLWYSGHFAEGRSR